MGGKLFGGWPRKPAALNKGVTTRYDPNERLKIQERWIKRMRTQEAILPCKAIIRREGQTMGCPVWKQAKDKKKPHFEDLFQAMTVKLTASGNKVWAA